MHDLSPTSVCLLLHWSPADQTLVIYSLVMSREKRVKKEGTRVQRSTLTWQNLPLVIPSSLPRSWAKSLDPLLFFSLATSSLPLLVHFSPLMQIALCSPHIYDPLPPSVKYALKNRGCLNAASHIGLVGINGQITSLLEWVKSKHSSMSIHEGALAFKGCVALSSIK